MLNAAHYVRDIEGYIVNPYDWDSSLAKQMAAEEGLELTQEYWPILQFMRDYWMDHHIIPDVRHVVEYLVSAQHYDKKSAKQHLFQLFPYGYVKQACKIAGMQRPRAWSTG
ncbi:MAG: TusE/DsrC/DsvC family sulfur relay protein [Gammaproteobacteria bacterium]|nr:TusE/DsrC/DsvC family sulfur relay protein [Gammaproteobacteria bacterium]